MSVILLSQQNRTSSTTDPNARQSIRNVKGNQFCADCDAASMYFNLCLIKKNLHDFEK